MAILKEAIRIISKDELSFLCPAVEKATENVIDGYKYESNLNTKQRFPELWKYKPEEPFTLSTWFVFYEKEERIKILNQTIKDIENDSNDIIHSVPDQG